MPEQQTDWPAMTGLLGFLLALLIAFKSWISSSFKDKKDAREAEIIRQEKERSETITKAVQSGLESFNKEIREEFKTFKITTDEQFRVVNDRIDGLFKELGNK